MSVFNNAALQHTVRKAALDEMNKAPKSVDIKFARVTGISGAEVFIQFDGDPAPSQKCDRKRLKSYVPAIGDRVMLINDVIIGGLT